MAISTMASITRAVGGRCTGWSSLQSCRRVQSLIGMPLRSRRAFTQTSQRRIMDTSIFTENQLMVKDAISKICSQFPDVRRFNGRGTMSQSELISSDRNTGLNVMRPGSIPMNSMPSWPRLGGLGLLCRRSLEERVWVFQRPR